MLKRLTRLHSLPATVQRRMSAIANGIHHVPASANSEHSTSDTANTSRPPSPVTAESLSAFTGHLQPVPDRFPPPPAARVTADSAGQWQQLGRALVPAAFSPTPSHAVRVRWPCRVDRRTTATGATIRPFSFTTTSPARATIATCKSMQAKHSVSPCYDGTQPTPSRAHTAARRRLLRSPLHCWLTLCLLVRVGCRYPRYNIHGLHALFLSHEHADAANGLDDLRSLQKFNEARRTAPLSHPFLSICRLTRCSRSRVASRTWWIVSCRRRLSDASLSSSGTSSRAGDEVQPAGIDGLNVRVLDVATRAGLYGLGLLAAGRARRVHQRREQDHGRHRTATSWHCSTHHPRHANTLSVVCARSVRWCSDRCIVELVHVVVDSSSCD